MFTVKFIRTNADSIDTVSICCPHYGVTAHDSMRRITITTFPSMLDEGGVERHLSDEVSPSGPTGAGKRLGYDVAYVENSSGITIATLRKPEAKSVGRAFSDKDVVDRGVSSN